MRLVPSSHDDDAEGCNAAILATLEVIAGAVPHMALSVEFITQQNVCVGDAFLQPPLLPLLRSSLVSLCGRFERLVRNPPPPPPTPPGALTLSP